MKIEKIPSFSEKYRLQISNAKFYASILALIIGLLALQAKSLYPDEVIDTALKDFYWLVGLALYFFALAIGLGSAAAGFFAFHFLTQRRAHASGLYFGLCVICGIAVWLLTYIVVVNGINHTFNVDLFTIVDRYAPNE